MRLTNEQLHEIKTQSELRVTRSRLGQSCSISDHLQAIRDVPRLLEHIETLKQAARAYIEAEKAYHAAHLSDSAGPGVCLRAQKAEKELERVLDEA